MVRATRMTLEVVLEQEHLLLVPYDLHYLELKKSMKKGGFVSFGKKINIMCCASSIFRAHERI
jgi:hypothetical protein